MYAYFSVTDDSPADPLVARLDPNTRARESEPLKLRFDARKVHLFDPETEVSLIR